MTAEAKELSRRDHYILAVASGCDASDWENSERYAAWIVQCGKALMAEADKEEPK